MLDQLSPTSGKTLRLMRLRGPAGSRPFVLPMDHSITEGPIGDAGTLPELLTIAQEAGVDAVVLHKGRITTVAVERWRGLAMIVHLSASTRRAPDPDAKILVTSVEEAVRLGAEAVSVHVNIGSPTETEQLSDLSRVVRDCARWEVPLLAMMYPRGPQVKDPSDPALIAHCATIATEVGADLVKVPWTGSPGTMRQVVESCPIPLLVAGGPRVSSLDALSGYVRDVVASSAAGVAMGRNIFESPDPAQAARRVATELHAEARQMAGAAALS